MLKQIPRAVQPTWTNWREALRLVAHRPYLKSTTSLALSVGCILFAINHLDEVLRGQATAVVWTKIGVTFLVPFCVSKYRNSCSDPAQVGIIELNTGPADVMGIQSQH